MVNYNNRFYLINILMAIIISCILTFQFGNGTLLGINKFKSLVYTSLEGFEINNAKLLTKNEIISTTNDSQMIIKNINTYIKNVSIEINKTSVKDYAIQVFYDTGRGFNPKEVTSMWARPGNNLLRVNSQLKITGIRIDPTNLADQLLVIGSITINQQPSSRQLSYLLIFNISFLIFILLYHTKSENWVPKFVTVIFYSFTLYIIDSFWLINVPPYINILFFIVLCLMLIVFPLIGKEVKQSAEERDQK